METVYRRRSGSQTMDKEIPLARQEEVRQSVLLAGTGASETRKDATHRDSGKKASTTPQGVKGSKVRSPKKKSEGDAEVEGGGGKRGRKRGRSYSLGDTIREAERRDTSFGRSSKELGITWLGVRCEDSPVTKAHYLVDRTKVGDGTIYECKYCHKVKWLPNTESDCIKLGNFLQIYGHDTGYQKILDQHPAAKSLMAKIQDIYYLKKSLPPEQFPLALAAIMLDREYPYDVDITEEEVL